jgi:hypothetical protein
LEKTAVPELSIVSTQKLQVTEWCSFCAARPSEGNLKVRDHDSGELVNLASCEECANKLLKEKNED